MNAQSSRYFSFDQLNPLLLVGVTGFEPATSWSQTTRSTKLSYTPEPDENTASAKILSHMFISPLTRIKARKTGGKQKSDRPLVVLSSEEDAVSFRLHNTTVRPVSAGR